MENRETASSRFAKAALVLQALLLLPSSTWSSPGADGASFLDIPTGARSAALGGAYSALASDAYAPVWNPSGLGFVRVPEFAGMHVAYQQASVSYEYLGLAYPFSGAQSLGFAVQYLRPGAVAGMDVNGNPTGSFSGGDQAYSLAYGRAITNSLSLGLTGKFITSKLAGVTASAYAFDLGGMYSVGRNLTLAAVAANMGTKLTYLTQGESLPLSFRLGASYSLMDAWGLNIEGAYGRSGASLRGGIEWKILSAMALRGGYSASAAGRSQGARGLVAGAGFTAFGARLDYAWVPLGDAGSTQYFSLGMKFGRVQTETPR